MAIVRNETDSRMSFYIATAATTIATQMTPIDLAGLPAASIYIANLCTANIHYDIKGCYNKDVSSTSYWYSIGSGTAAAATVTCIGMFGAGQNVSALGNPHKALTVEYYASGSTTGGFVLQIMAW